MSAPVELELKLALAADAVAILPTLPPLSKHPVTRFAMRNQYFDTPGRDLEAARIALRLRRFDQTIVQTVKTAGHGSGGLHQRGEWEWTLATHQLDTDALAQLASDGVAHCPELQCLASPSLRAELAPLYSTDFIRDTWQIEHAGGHIEVALDQGTLQSGDAHLPIRELELELKAGEPAALWSLAACLSEHVALRPANASKAQRAVALGHGYRTPQHAVQGELQLFDSAIDALDAAADGFMPEGYITAATLLSELAVTMPQPLNALAHRMATALHQQGEKALDRCFGQACLQLMPHFVAER